MHGAWAQYMRRLGPGEGDRAPVVGDLMDWDVTAVRVPVERVPPVACYGVLPHRRVKTAGTSARTARAARTVSRGVTQSVSVMRAA